MAHTVKPDTGELLQLHISKYGQNADIHILEIKAYAELYSERTYVCAGHHCAVFGFCLVSCHKVGTRYGTFSKALVQQIDNIHICVDMLVELVSQTGECLPVRLERQCVGQVGILLAEVTGVQLQFRLSICERWVELKQELGNACYVAAVEIEVACCAVGEVQLAIIIAVLGVLQGHKEMHAEPIYRIEYYVSCPSDSLHIIFYGSACSSVGLRIGEVGVRAIVAL